MDTQASTRSIPSRGKGFFSYLLHTNRQVWILYLIFAGLSLYTVMSATGTETYDYIFKGSGSISPVLKQVGIVLGSIALTAFMPLICKAKYLRVGWLVYSFFSLFLLVMLWLHPVTINGAARWTSILGVSIQPSEFWKLWFIGWFSLFSCTYLEAGSPKGWVAYLRYFGIPIGGALVLIAIIANENASTGAIYILVMAILCLIYKMPIAWYAKTFTALGLSAVFIGGVLFFVVPKDALPGRLSTVVARIERKLNAKEEDKFVLVDENRQEMYARMALANSNYIGRGPGNSNMKDMLPMASSDYVFAVLVEELGILGLIGVPALYVWWFFIIAGMAKREQGTFNRYILYGIGVFYPLQALINFVVVSGLITTGQPLPFISTGGSSFLSNSIVIGVMLIISRGQYEYRAGKYAEELSLHKEEQGEDGELQLV